MIIHNIKNPNIILCFIAIILFNYKQVFALDLTCPNPSGLATGRPGGQFGPYDYRDPANRGGSTNRLQIVESYHFNTDVATLTKGLSGSLAGDLSYTLRAFPNHHRALQSLADLGIREKKANISGLSFTVPCFFLRAKNFASTDGMVNAVYAYYLANINQKEMANFEAGQAIKNHANNPRVFYQVGLAYFYMGDYKKAQECSKQAKKLGSKALGLDSLLSNVSSIKNMH